MCRSSKTEKPRFLGQGLLIIFPAILLAVVGLYSLRQDRILAEHDAIEQAQRMADNLVHQVLPGALGTVALPLGAEERFRVGMLAPADDPFLRNPHERESMLFGLLDYDGKLLYPPAVSRLSPEPLDLDQLTPEQSHFWQEAGQATFATTNFNSAISALQQLVAAPLPTNFAAAVRYRLAMECLKLGRMTETRTNFEEGLRLYPEAYSEVGIPWRQFTRIQLLRLALKATNHWPETTAWLNALYGDTVLRPTPLSVHFLRTAMDIEAALTLSKPTLARRIDPELLAASTGQYLTVDFEAPIGEAWRVLWNSHVTSRFLYEQALRQSDWLAVTNASSFWFTVEDDPNAAWLAQLIRADNGQFWMVARSAKWLKRLMEHISSIQRSPPYFQVGVTVAGRLLTTNVHALMLAKAVSGGTNSVPEMQVAVFLTDPDSLYARQRARTIWFGTLIALSGMAVLIGFVSARKAFLRQQHLNEMKTNFVSSVSHELRAPIASVRLMAEELEDARGQDAKKNQTYHHFMVQECRRLSSLIENVLDFSRQEQGRKQYEFEPTDMVALVRETAQLMQSYGSDRQISVATQVRGEPVEVEVDGRAIQQILVNLLDNAIKHSPKGTGVTVGLDFPSMNWFRFWVEDHGEGIPAEDHERIFERFYRRGSELRRETQGVGLGLAIVKYVTEAHGGRVLVQSAVGQGSRFTVELPRRPSDIVR